MPTAVSITELVEVCEQMVGRNRALFELLGGWVAGEPDSAVQRWWSTAAHRHAWHAELWQARRPAIPIDAGGEPPVIEPPSGTRERVAWYLAELAEVTADVDSLVRRVDVDLDPATARVVRLVVADLEHLAETAPSA